MFEWIETVSYKDRHSLCHCLSLTLAVFLSTSLSPETVSVLSSYSNSNCISQSLPNSLSFSLPLYHSHSHSQSLSICISLSLSICISPASSSTSSKVFPQPIVRFFPFNAYGVCTDCLQTVSAEVNELNSTNA